MRMALRTLLGLPALAALLGGCAVSHPPSNAASNAQLAPATHVTHDLEHLPEPKGKVVVAVYGMRDQTGQYKPAPDSSFSTAVTQGAASLLIKALRDSGWFIPVERENLQDLLTERKIVRALETPPEKGAAAGTQGVNLPALTPASILIEGGVIAYESNVRTGGIGASYLGISLFQQYRVDQVTVNLRSVDIRSGQILNSVSTSKTIYSYENKPSVYKFVNFKDLVQFEVGQTRNEPAQLCVREAIEAAVVHLTVQGIKDHVWALKNDADMHHALIASYLREGDELREALDERPAPASQVKMEGGP
jgi:curli production assembly/transport component CsgG